MTSLIDALAEQQIAAAISRGELDDLPGQGKPLLLDDDRFVPESLRAAYRILKNAGYLPPELEQCREAVRLCDLLGACRLSGDVVGEASATKRLREIELRLHIRGFDTRFLQDYLHRFSGHDRSLRA